MLSKTKFYEKIIEFNENLSIRIRIWFQTYLQMLCPDPHAGRNCRSLFSSLGSGVEALVKSGEVNLAQGEGAGVGILGGHQLVQHLLRQRCAVLVVAGHQPSQKHYDIQTETKGWSSWAR
jgi:hypothetical protein